MTAIVRFEDSDGSTLYVEVDDQDYSVQRVSRGSDAVIEAADRLDTVLDRVRPTIERVVTTIRRMAPEEFEVEFGLKLNAETGVVVARTAAEAHFTVTMSWKHGGPPTPVP